MKQLRLLAFSLLVLPIVFLSSSLAGTAPDETPGRPGEWGFRPLDGRTSSVDPPAFVWRPQKAAASYELEVADNRQFVRPLYGARDIGFCCHTPPRTFGEGTYHWRFRFVTKKGTPSAWSTTRSFRIDSAARAFPMPERAELLRRIPSSHPRLFLRPEDVPRLEKLVRGPLKDRWKEVLRECDGLLARPPDITEPPTYPPEAKRGKNDKLWKSIWWGNRKRVIGVTNGAATLALGWLLEGDERYAREARRLVLAACRWDPKGATGYRYNDEAGMPFAYYTARTYTWLHDFLSEGERNEIRKVMKVRGDEMYRHLAGRPHFWRPYSSHANRAWHWLGEVGTAFCGEIEGADDWAWFALNVFFNTYPVWNDDAGGWHEGIAYWSSYVGRVTWWLAILRSAYGIDGFQKPFFAHAGDFPLYISPPGEHLGGFGDLTLGFTARRCSALVGLLARAAHNAAWQWYAEQSGGPQLPGGYQSLFCGMLPAVKAREPRNLPSSIVFPGVGVAALHADLVERDKDVLFLFKSSPMGTQSHGYDSQNAFLLSVRGDPVFVYSGWRDLYGSPHHKNWMWETRSQNCILVDGKGQRKHSPLPLGKITRFAATKDFDYVVGEAAPAYGGLLERFTRAVLFVKPEAIVIFDDLVAARPSTFQWLLHARRKMEVDGQTIRARGLKQGAATVRILMPEDLEIRQTDRFDPPPQEWVHLTQWHLTASIRAKRKSAAFVTVIRPGAAGAQPVEARALSSKETLSCELRLSSGTARVVWRREEGRGEISCDVIDSEGKRRRRFER